MKSVLLECQGLSFSYRLGQRQVPALQQVSHGFGRQSFNLLMGPSGSGKSTLLNLLGLIEPLQSGDIWLDGQSYRQLDEASKNHWRRYRFGFIFQDFHLFDVLTVAENVSFFLRRQGLSRSEIASRVEEALTVVGLQSMASKKPNELSGGQRQRVAVARAMAKKPEVLIADEPTASLDQQTSHELLSVMQKLLGQGLTIIMSSHDPIAQEFADETLTLVDGRLLTAKEDTRC